jgi:hypothetical protein
MLLYFLQEAGAQSSLGAVSIVATLIVHILIYRNIQKPLANLSLKVAVSIDKKEGAKLKDSNVRAIDRQLYGQPCLKASLEERGPMPYRRGIDDDEEDQPVTLTRTVAFGLLVGDENEAKVVMTQT